MGIPVTVDSDDLEALLQSTGAFKAVESILNQALARIAGTLARPHDDSDLRVGADAREARYAEAHDRIAKARLGALRAADSDPVPFVLAQREKDILIQLWGTDRVGDDIDWPVPVDIPMAPRRFDGASVDVAYTEYHGSVVSWRNDVRALQVRGLIELGVHREEWLWGNSGARTVRDEPRQYARLTKRGIDALRQARL